MEIYSNSEQKFLRRVVVYASGDNAVMKLSKGGKDISFEDAQELATKGLLVVNVSDVYQEVVGYKVNGQAFEVYCLDMSAAPAKKTYKSANKKA